MNYACSRYSIIIKRYLCVSSSELSHWRVPRGGVYTMEATAYALLALVKAQVSMSHLCFIASCQKTYNRVVSLSNSTTLKCQ